MVNNNKILTADPNPALTTSGLPIPEARGWKVALEDWIVPHDVDQGSTIEVAAAEGYLIAACALLQSATETPELDEWLETVSEPNAPTLMDSHDFDKWRAYSLVHSAECLACGSYNYFDSSTDAITFHYPLTERDETTCSNCGEETRLGAPGESSSIPHIVRASAEVVRDLAPMVGSVDDADHWLAEYSRAVVELVEDFLIEDDDLIYWAESVDRAVSILKDAEWRDTLNSIESSSRDAIRQTFATLESCPLRSIPTQMFAPQLIGNAPIKLIDWREVKLS